MNPLRLIVGALLFVALPACGLREPVTPPAPEPATPAAPPAAATSPAGATEQQQEAIARLVATMAAQDRVNRYFHHDVLPKLKDCWAGVAGEGNVAIQVVYRRYDSQWTAGDSAIHKSTLAAGQDEIALRCLAQAVRDTSFATEEVDRDAEEYYVYWSLPVPWPQDMGAFIKKMAMDDDGGGGGGGGGCGVDVPPACQACWIWSLGFKFSLCIPACNGYPDCLAEADGNGCRHTNRQCVTAPIFANAGGFVIY